LPAPRTRDHVRYNNENLKNTVSSYILEPFGLFCRSNSLLICHFNEGQLLFSVELDKAFDLTRYEKKTVYMVRILSIGETKMMVDSAQCQEYQIFENKVYDNIVS
jgi:hypothetical protein